MAIPGFNQARYIYDAEEIDFMECEEVLSRVWDVVRDFFELLCAKIYQCFGCSSEVEETSGNALQEEIQADLPAALKRLREIENLEFTCTDTVLDFDLDQLMGMHSSYLPDNGLLDLFDYANPFPRNAKQIEWRGELITFLRKYERGEHKYDGGVLYRPAVVAKVEKRIGQIFNLLNNEIKKRPSKDLQLLISSSLTRIRQAFADGCIVQINSQLDNLSADLLAQTSTSCKTQKKQLQYMAGAALYKHRRELIKGLVRTEVDDKTWDNGTKRDDENEQVRVAADEIYNEEAVLALIEGRIPQAHYNTFENRNKRDRFNAMYTEEPCDGSLDQRPLPFLMRGVSHSDSAEDVGTLKMDLLKWAVEHFKLDEENETTAEIIRLASKKTTDRRDGDAFIMCETDLSELGTKWLLEAAGITEE